MKRIRTWFWANRRVVVTQLPDGTVSVVIDGRQVFYA